MSKNILFIIITLIPMLTINAQTQFDNASFENWEEIGFGPNIIEPVEWSSIKSSDHENISGQAPHVWDRSESGNAHSGDYSLYLHTVTVFGIVATGTLTNGRYHAEFNTANAFTFTDTVNSQWHTRISAKPDSLAGWYKAKPSAGDFPTVKVVLHTGYAQISAISDTSTYVASAVISLPEEEVTEWTRFSFPIEYHTNDDPEYALVILTSSNGLSAVDKSEAWFDDIEFIYNDGTGIMEKNDDAFEVHTYQDELTVFIDADKKERYELIVFDMSGKRVISNTGWTKEKNTFNMNLPRGIYAITVTYGRKTLTKKVVL